MPLFTFRCLPPNPFVFPSQSPTLMCSYKPISSSSYIRIKPISATIPSRDKIIDFGKHRGKMLGTLPSKYLKWVSKTLRARDFEEWAKLADEVLQDPVYKDRVEWELAETVLNGDTRISFSSANENSVSNLLEISERFGWDNEDKIGWNKINFELLGTSKGGRIPRKNSPSRVSQVEKICSFDEDFRVSYRERKSGALNRGSSFRVSQWEKMDIGNPSIRHSRVDGDGKSGRNSIRVSKMEEISSRGKRERKVGFLSKGSSFRVPEMEERGSIENSRVYDEEIKLDFLGNESSRVIIEGDEVVGGNVGGGREERRERQRLRRGLQMHNVKLGICLNRKKEGDLDNQFNQDQDYDLKVKRNSNPFPGRETLLKKVLNKERDLRF